MEQNRKHKKVKNHSRVLQAIAAWRGTAHSNSDVLGWYTGSPSDYGDEVPEQDQDDL